MAAEANAFFRYIQPVCHQCQFHLKPPFINRFLFEQLLDALTKPDALVRHLLDGNLFNLGQPLFQNADAMAEVFAKFFTFIPLHRQQIIHCLLKRFRYKAPFLVVGVFHFKRLKHFREL